MNNKHWTNPDVPRSDYLFYRSVCDHLYDITSRQHCSEISCCNSYCKWCDCCVSARLLCFKLLSTDFTWRTALTFIIASSQWLICMKVISDGSKLACGLACGLFCSFWPNDPLCSCQYAFVKHWNKKSDLAKENTSFRPLSLPRLCTPLYCDVVQKGRPGAKCASCSPRQHQQHYIYSCRQHYIYSCPKSFLDSPHAVIDGTLLSVCFSHYITDILFAFSSWKHLLTAYVCLRPPFLCSKDAMNTAVIHTDRYFRLLTADRFEKATGFDFSLTIRAVFNIDSRSSGSQCYIKIFKCTFCFCFFHIAQSSYIFECRFLIVNYCC